MRAPYKMREVTRTFMGRQSKFATVDRPLMEMSCGHVRPDTWATYSNETAVRVKIAVHALVGGERKARCYQCGKEAVTGSREIDAL